MLLTAQRAGSPFHVNNSNNIVLYTSLFYHGEMSEMNRCFSVFNSVAGAGKVGVVFMPQCAQLKLRSCIKRILNWLKYEK